MDEEERADEERRIVIGKYDLGREEGAQIDDWEDPALPLYHSTDRYGFIHDQPLPRHRSEGEDKRVNIELGREMKWLKMRAKWDKYKGSEKLRERTYKGIPDKVRVWVWALLLDVDKEKRLQRGKYDEMLELGRNYSPDVRQIDLDVNRTYRDHINFRERFGTSQKSLFNILCAYSVYNSEVGYCQGMSQIAALLLMYLAEEDAFWALSQLMTNIKYGMHGFFIAGFPKLLRFQAHHDRVLSKMLSKLKRHFDKHGVDTGLYTLKWFFQCFLDRVPFELALRLWDIFLLEGDRVLICGAYMILRIHSKSLLSKKNMDDILSYLQSKIPLNFGMDFDRAIDLYEEWSEELSKKRLDYPGPTTEEETPKRPFGVFEVHPKKTTIAALLKKPAFVPPPPQPTDEEEEVSSEDPIPALRPSVHQAKSETRNVIVPQLSSSGNTSPVSSILLPDSGSSTTSGETVRIHVPYEPNKPKIIYHHIHLEERATNGFEKNDPNRIKIDISSSAL